MHIIRFIIIMVWVQLGAYQVLLAQHRVNGCEVVTGIQAFHHADMEVKAGANFINNGTVYYSGVSSLINHGGFSELGSCPAQYTDPCTLGAGSSGVNIFDNTTASTTISGSEPLRMFDVSLNRNILLNNEWQIAGTFDWMSGLITTSRDNTDQFVLFLQGSVLTDFNDDAHVHGYAAWNGSGSFTFPIGDGTKRGLATIIGTCGTVFKAAYFDASPDDATLPAGAPFSRTALQSGLREISDWEYWDIDGNDSTHITLNFDPSSHLAEFSDNLSDLVIVGWNGTQWISLGNIANGGELATGGYVTSNKVIPNDYFAYTFGIYCPEFLSGAIEITGETICYAGTPAAIGSETAASGGDNNISYSWRSSADNYTADIPDATSATYTPPAGLTATTSYRRYANDGACSTTPTVSTGTWTVTVLPAPALTCPADFTAGTASNGGGDCTGSASWNHPVETAGACTPVQLRLSINGGTPFVVSAGTNYNTAFPKGEHALTYTISDGQANTASCNFTVTIEDNEQPTLTCVPSASPVLNGQSSLTLTAEDLVISLGDNCGSVQTIITPPVLSSAQFGQVIPVQVMVFDEAENVSVCTVPVSMQGVPPGWRHTSGSVGDCASTADYAYSTGTWTATAVSCRNNSPFQQDALMFAQYALCGDGSITAQVSGLSGGAAFAGIMMRESNAVGAKKVQLMINRSSNIARREVRYTSGGQAFPAEFSSPATRTWLRIERIGHNFRAYTSMDGLSWWYVMNVHVPMNSCIEMGLVLTNMLSGVQSTATYAHVSVTGSGGAPQVTLPGDAMDQLMGDALDVQVYPNPTEGDVRVDITGQEARAVSLLVYDMHGRLMHRQEAAGERISTGLDVRTFPKGVYTMVVMAEGLAPQTRRVVVAGQ